MLEIGSQLGEYEILARLRSGGMAALYIARKRGAAGFARPVAIKVIHPHLAANETFVNMFIDEAKLSSRIDHPFVVRVEELGEANGMYFLAMEYVQGVALNQLLHALNARQRRLSPAAAVFIAIQIAEGLHAAHETSDEEGKALGVVHRDISPQNVILAQNGNVKLIDFGIAKARGRSQDTTSTGELRGKLGYMPPEQAWGKPLDRRADVYALGVVLWEMLTARRLFTADNDFAMLERVRHPEVRAPSEYAPGVPPALDAVVMAALAPKPEDRPPTAQALRRMLAAVAPARDGFDGSSSIAALVDAVQKLFANQTDPLPDGLRDALATIHVHAESALPRAVRLAEPTHTAIEIDDIPETILRTLTVPTGDLPAEAIARDEPVASRRSAPRSRRVMAAIAGLTAVTALAAVSGAWMAHAFVSTNVTQPSSSPSLRPGIATPLASPPVSSAATSQAPNDAPARSDAGVATTAHADAGRVVTPVAHAVATTPAHTHPAIRHRAGRDAAGTSRTSDGLPFLSHAPY